MIDKSAEIYDGQYGAALYYVKDTSQLCTVPVALQSAPLSLFLGVFVTLWNATISFIMSVCAHRTTLLPQDRYS